jgi:hypothetical protein
MREVPPEVLEATDIVAAAVAAAMWLCLYGLVSSGHPTAARGRGAAHVGTR